MEKQAKVVQLKTQLVKEGHTRTMLAETELMTLRIHCYAPGIGENALHSHTKEDHIFLVLQGTAQFNTGRDGQTIQPEGIKGSDLTDKQQEMLLDLASEWSGIAFEAVAKAKIDEIKKNIAETWFAWSGPTEKGSAAYFRVQGPTVIIEYAPQRLGGDPTKHIHTIYRDPTNEYGARWWKP